MLPVRPPGTDEDADTFAVNVIGCVTLAGFRDEVREAVVEMPVMTCESDPLLAGRLPEGTYVAVMGWVPTISELMEKEAAAAFAMAGVSGCMARTVDPSENVTEPAGGPELVEALVTVAVKVTDCEYGEGLSEEASDVLVTSPVTICVSDAVALEKFVEGV